MKRFIILTILLALATSSYQVFACAFTKTVYTKYENEDEKAWRIFDPTITVDITAGQRDDESYGVIASMGYIDVQLALFWFSKFRCNRDSARALKALETNDWPFGDDQWDRLRADTRIYNYGEAYMDRHQIRDKMFNVIFQFDSM